jgi:hypothetical protein
MFYYRHGLFIVGAWVQCKSGLKTIWQPSHTETLCNNFNIVVFASGGFSALQQASEHHLFGRIEEDDQRGKAQLIVLNRYCDMIKEAKVMTHRFIECQSLIHLPREAVDQEPAFAIRPPISSPFLQRFSHGVLKELHGNMGWYESAFLNAVSN